VTVLSSGVGYDHDDHMFAFQHIIIPPRKETRIPKSLALTYLIRVREGSLNSIPVLRQKVGVMFRYVELALLGEFDFTM